MHTRVIQLPKGGELNLEIKPQFYDVVRSKLNLNECEYVSDDHIRMFIYGCVKSAVDKEESAYAKSPSEKIDK